MKSQLIKNQIFSNYFDTTFQSPSNQSPSFEKSQNKTFKNPFQSTQKKPNRIKQTKQLLFQKLKQVTPFQSVTENHPSTTTPNYTLKNSEDQNKLVECYFNPISKLTKQPFVRSKTCQQMRKQFSLKKARKKNNSASKFNTPNTQTSCGHPQSTGINSTQNPIEHTNSSNKRSNQKANMKKQTTSNIQTKQFSLDPFIFGGPVIETFNKAQIEKLQAQDFQKNKIKTKLTLGKKTTNDPKETLNIPSQLHFPFKINVKGNKDQNVEIKSTLVLQSSFRNIEDKFTPRLQRHPLSGQLNESKNIHKKSSKQLESIQLSEQIEGSRNSQQPSEALQQEHEIEEEDYEMDDEDTSYDYSSQQHSKGAEYINQRQSQNLEYSEKNLVSQNELVASLHMTNTILQEKLKIKEQEIHELKTELIQVKNSKSQIETGISNPKQLTRVQQKKQNASMQQPLKKASKPPKYLTNFDFQKISHSIGTVNDSSQVINLSSKGMNNPKSPKFHLGIQEEFSRQREIIPQQQEQNSNIYQSFNPSYGQMGNSNRLRFNKKQELFPSGLQQYVSQYFDSKEIYHTNSKYKLSNELKYEKKKNSVNPALLKLNLQNRRVSLACILNDEFSINESGQKQMDASFFGSSTKKGSNYIPTEEMLLDSDRTHQPIQSSQDERISQLSPIKFNENEKMESNQSRYLKFKESFQKGEYVIPFDQSFNKSEYCLTPQKDESRKGSRSQCQEGLFQKAFSTLRKSESPFKILETNPINISQTHMIDFVIED